MDSVSGLDGFGQKKTRFRLPSDGKGDESAFDSISAPAGHFRQAGALVASQGRRTDQSASTWAIVRPRDFPKRTVPVLSAKSV